MSISLAQLNAMKVANKVANKVPAVQPAVPNTPVPPKIIGVPVVHTTPTNGTVGINSVPAPVVAPAPTTNYGGSGNPLNEILYSKQQYEAGNKVWAANNATPYYGKLDTNEASLVKSMSTQQLKDYIAAKHNTATAKTDIAGNPTEVNHNGSTAPVDVNAYKTDTASIDDIAKKYGFDYSRDYANTQAEAEAQAKRNAYNQTLRLNEAQKKENMQQIDTNVYNASDAMDQTGFQALQQSNQNQTINGQNMGIAGDQNLRLAMNQQNQMGSIYGDAANARTAEQNRFTNQMLTAMEGLALTEQEKLAYADKLYNDRLQQGFSNSMQVNQFNQTDNLAMLQAALQQRGMNIGQDQFNRTFDQNQGQIDWNKVVDQSKLTGKYNGQVTQDQKNVNTANAQNQQQIDWAKVVQTAGLTGNFNGAPTADQAQRIFANDLATKQFNRPYEQLTKYEQAQINSQAEANRISAARQASSASSSSSSKDSLFDLNATQFDAVQKAYQSGTPAQKQALAAKYPELNMFGSGGASADEQLFLQGLQEGGSDVANYQVVSEGLKNSDAPAEMKLKLKKIAKDYFDNQTKEKAAAEAGNRAAKERLAAAEKAKAVAEKKRVDAINAKYHFTPNQSVTDNVFGR